MANIYKSNYTGSQVDDAIGKVVNGNLQEKLTAGNNITISGNTISATVPTIPSITITNGTATTPTSDTVAVISGETASGHTITTTKVNVATQAYVDKKFDDTVVTIDTLNTFEAKLNENIIKNPDKTYLVWKGNQFPNDTAKFIPPVGFTIDWGDGNVETFETESTETQTHTYVDGIEYHLISLSNYTIVGNPAFTNCIDLINVIIGNSVTTIGYNAISGCSSLASVTIPDSVTSIGDYAFSDCSGLTSVIIGNSVTTIGVDAFSGCSKLKTIRVSATNPPTLDIRLFDDTTPIEKIIVPKSAINSYKSVEGWSTYADKIVYEVDSSDLDAAVTNLENGEGQYSLIQKVAPSTTTDPNNYAKGKEAVALGRYNKTYGDRSMTVNYDNENYGKWSFVANTKNKNGSKDVPQENVQSNAMFGCANEIKVGIEGLVAGKSNVNYEGDRFNISGSENENHTNNVRMSGRKNKSLKEIKTPITSGGGGGGGGSTNPDTNPTEPTQPFDYTSDTGYADISGTENKVFAMGGRTRGVAGICYSPFGSTEGFWTKAGYLVEDTTKSTETEKYYKPQGLGAKAFGRATHAKEDFTIAGGEHSVALKKGANAIGYYTTANTEWGTVIGKYNVGKTNTLFEVGNGYAVFDAGRKNAFEVLKDGRAKVQSVPVDDDDVVRKQELNDINSNLSTKANKTYVDEIAVKVLTQKQVDLLF